ncbi:MAG: L,D-transpeptidase family protein, partial [Chitinophagales bacterium]
CCCLFLLLISCNELKEEINSPPRIFINESIALPHLVDSLQINQNSMQIYISKKEKELYIKSDTILLKSYPVVFGFNPIDDKRMEGDGCTPEGSFEVRDRYPHKKWSKFIWVNYPTEDSWQKHKKAKEQGAIAETETIGGQIGIHGVPKGQDFLIDLNRNWTLGCISLKNKHINEFYPYVTKGTKIEIEGVGERSNKNVN